MRRDFTSGLEMPRRASVAATVQFAVPDQRTVSLPAAEGPKPPDAGERLE